MKEIHLLHDREIPLSSVSGRLYRARHDKGYCVSCGEPISAGEQYIQKMFTTDFSHVECWMFDHDMTIVRLRGEQREIDGVTILCHICGTEDDLVGILEG